MTDSQSQPLQVPHRRHSSCLALNSGSDCDAAGPTHSRTLDNLNSFPIAGPPNDPAKTKLSLAFGDRTQHHVDNHVHRTPTHVNSPWLQDRNCPLNEPPRLKHVFHTFNNIVNNDSKSTWTSMSFIVFVTVRSRCNTRLRLGSTSCKTQQLGEVKDARPDRLSKSFFDSPNLSLIAVKLTSTTMSCGYV